jgi:hypothetical protein
MNSAAASSSSPPPPPALFNEQQLILSEADKQVLFFILYYTVGIFILWNFPYLKHILHPFKLIVTGLHEFGHAAAGKCTGAKISSIEISLDTCGVTRMRGGVWWITMPAGYIGSAFFGGLMVFSGFNVWASRAVSILICLCFVATLYWAKGALAHLVALMYIGLVIFGWVFEDGYYLKFLVLFVGVMASLQSLWDFQGLVLHTIPSSDASKFAEKCRCMPAQAWAFIWFVLSAAFMAGFALLGVVVFN